WIDSSVFGGRRGRSGQCSLEFVAAGNVRTGRRIRERRSQTGGGIASQTLLVVQRFVYRTESGSDKDRIVVDREHLGGSTVAALRNECGKSGAFAQNAGEV